MLDLVKGLTRRRRRDAAHAPTALHANRAALAATYLRGNGLEIGALHQPLPLPSQARVRYVDRLPVPELRKHYPELHDWPLVDVDIIDDGEVLRTIPQKSQDFLIANHFLEHCEDPIGAMKTFFRVLAPGGVAYVAVPDHRYTFDRHRPVTPLGHLRCDHERGPAGSRHDHYLEWVCLVNQVRDHAEALRQAADLNRRNYSIHFHVWDQPAWLEFLLAMQRDLGFEIEVFLKSGIEIIAVLRQPETGAIS